MTPTRSLIILGLGYTGRFILPLASRRYDLVVSSSRDPEVHLTDVPADRRLQFDLNRPATWCNLHPEADLLWCFPAAPVERVRQLAAFLKTSQRNLVVLGSTSAYDTARRSHEYPPAWIDETAPVDLGRPRVQGEEFLRTNCSAILLRVAGIYGPGRNPLDWIRSGRVTASRKYVNLIHVEDLAAICLIALERGLPGTIYNVSDGRPRTWDEICSAAERLWRIRSAPGGDETAVGKRISNTKMLTLLESGGDRLRHPDLTEALHHLQNMHTTPSATP